MFILLLVIFQVQTKNQYCLDAKCESCTDSKLNYQKASCLDVCPTHYILDQISSSCTNNVGSQKLFLIKFNLVLNYHQSEISDFYHPENQLFKDDQHGPIPTKDRGFYFSDTSRLITNSTNILAPSFGLGMVLRILSPGSIFTIRNGTNLLFEIIAQSFKVEINYFVCSSFCGFQTQSIDHLNSWIKLSVNFEQNYDKLTTQMNLNISNSVFEFRPSSDDLNYFFGNNPGGFKGFIYYFELSNSKFSKEIIFFLNNCSETQFFFQDVCSECPSDKIWPLCAFANGNACYSANCTSCTGYGFKDCENCISPVSPSCILAKNCEDGDRFNCVQCKAGFYSSSGVCILTPTPNKNPEKSITADFGLFMQDNQYFEWPSTVSDGNESSPTPMRFRGHYFNGSGYFKNKISIQLNHSFTVAFWVLKIKSNTLFESNTLTITGGCDISILLSNREDSKIAFSREKVYNNNWHFFAVIVKLEVPKTTISRFFNNILEQVYAIDGYAFYDEEGQVFVGCSLDKTSCFQGFVHNLDLWQYAFDSIIYNKTPACPDNTASCLQLCSPNEYFNTWEKNCQPCNKNCSFGCASWESCRKCNVTTCVSCSRSYFGECLIHTPNDGACAVGLVLKNESCCDDHCRTCYGPYFFKCLSCDSPRLVYKNICVDSCPSGYSVDGTSECMFYQFLILSFTFLNIHSPTFDACSNKPALFGADKQIISAEKETHPRPASHRGYYFKNNSFVTGPELTLPIDAAVSFFINVEEDGLVFSLGSLKWFSNGTFAYELRRLATNFEPSNSSFLVGGKKSWVAYTLMLSKNIHGSSFITLYKNSEMQSKELKLYLIYNPQPTTVVIGVNSSLGFQGFLYNFKVYARTLTTVEINSLNTTLNSLNLWTCEFKKYYEKGFCKDCDPNCTTCVRSGDCVLCDDLKCKLCTSFTSTCTECFSTSFLNNSNGACSCPFRTTWNQSSGHCEICPDLCESCLSSGCSVCTENSSLTSGFCKCDPQHYQANSTVCDPCHITCSECIGPQKENCTDCVVHASLTKDRQCLCDEGFHRTGFNCSPCFKLCKSCIGNAFNQCLACKVNLLNKDSSCVCPSSTYWNESMFYCDFCEESCLECEGRSFYQCSECHEESSMLAGFCTFVCPVGYSRNDGKCLEKYPKNAYTRFSFKELTGLFVDEVSGLIARTGSSLSSDCHEAIPAYARGLYFNGNQTSVLFTSLDKQILLGPDFCISFWIKSEVRSFLIFQYFHNKTLNFNVSFNELKVRIDFGLLGEEFKYQSSSEIKLYEWNHLLLVLKHVYFTETHVKTNKLDGFRKSLTLSPFKDFLNSTFQISSCSNSSNSFKGFFFSLEFYVQQPLIETLVFPGNCENCSTCLVDGSCIAQCSLTSFPYQETCADCLDSCYSGCRHDKSCSLCHDLNCLNCWDYQQNSCFECQAGFELLNNSCSKCKTNTFYDIQAKSCIPCKKLCKTCLSELECTACVDRSSFDEKSECVCDFGYFLAEGCERKKFSALLSVDFQNKAKVLFTEELATALNLDDIEVTINSEKISFQVKQVDAYTYHLFCSFSKRKKGDKLNIRFAKQLVSVNNALLLTERLAITLYSDEKNPLEGIIQDTKNIASRIFIAEVTASFGCAALILDPAFLFSTLTNVEMYSYAAMYDIEFDPELIRFLNSIQVQSRVPNIVAFFITESNTKPLKQKYIDFGYDSNLILKNSGVNFTVLVITIVLILPTFLIPKTKFKFFNDRVQEFQKSFKYRVFIRIFIQSFFEICLNSMIGISTSEMSGILENFDLVICGICLVMLIQTIQITLSTYLVRLVIKKSSVSNEQSKIIEQKFETIFCEFKEVPNQGFYYIIFLIRRMTIAVLIIFSMNPVLQLTISAIFSIAVMNNKVLVYLIGAYPYTNSVIQCYTLITELLLLSFYLFLAIPFISNLSIQKKELTLKCIQFITGALLLNIFFAFIVLFQKILTWIQQKLARNKLALVTNINNENCVDKGQSDVNFVKQNI